MKWLHPHLVWWWMLGACAAGQPSVTSVPTTDDVRVLHGTTWRWFGAKCDDGEHALDAHGYADDLRITAVGRGLRFMHERAMGTEGCTESVVTWVSADGPGFRFLDHVRVADRGDGSCVPPRPDEIQGELHHASDRLRVRHYRSVLCGGYDVVHEYRRTSGVARDDRALVRRHLVGLILRDPELMSEAYAETASLVVPRPVAEGGGVQRLEGRAAVREFFATMTRGAQWAAARVVRMHPSGEGEYTMDFEYMDGALQQPLSARWIVTLTDGQVFESRLLLTSDVLPATQDVPVVEPPPTD